MLLNKLTDYGRSRNMLDTFRGYHHAGKISEGEWYEEKNMTAEEYPVLATRAARGTVAQLTNPQGLSAKDAIAYVDGANLIYNGYTVEMELSTAANMCPKQLVSMGAYLLIWPDKKYVNTQDLSDKGSMEHSNTTAADVTVQLCDSEGNTYESVGISKPDSPENGDLWLDIGGETAVLQRYSASSGMWVQIPTTYLKLSCANIGAGFEKYDGVKLSGFTGNRTFLNGTFVLQAAQTNAVVVTGIMKQAQSTETAAVTAARLVPAMDYVTECDNRIWGCRYGLEDGKAVNEIYASKLGDFKNWNCFMGLSTDSYAASRGSDGMFTGAATLQGHPLFFKEDCIEKVYPSTTGAHQIVTTAARGVQKGCWRSLCIVGETLYYKSRADVCAYTGSLPVSVSEALGDELWSDARAGSVGERYYLAMKNSNNVWWLLVYDAEKGMWHKEDNVRPLCFTVCDGELYYIDEDSKKLMSVSGRVGTAESAAEWMIESGVIGYAQPEHKYISRFVFRADLPAGSSLQLEIRYDEGEWEKKGKYDRSGLGSFVLPVAPRRCDHLRYRLTGKGQVRIYSVATYRVKGSDRTR